MESLSFTFVFRAASALGWIAVVVAARARRGPLYAKFIGVLLGLHTLIACALVRHVGPLAPAFVALQGAATLHFFMLSRPRMRPLAYRALVSLPASYFVAATFLSLPWAIAAGLGATPHGLWVPFALAGVGIFQSLTLRREEVDILVDRAPVEGLVRHGARRRDPGEGTSARPLRIVQITDPHIGPFMPVARLRRICARAVERDPDLVVLTGDFLTMESQDTAEHLAEALSPLRALEGRVFACPGNHDHESPAHVATALARAGARLLVDDAALVETAAGPVQILGMDYHYRDRKARMAAVCARHPRVPGALRLVLLHNPGAFRDLGEGEGDLVLSGHTHGGQIGLVSLGLPWTILRLFVKMPDHGLWARGRDRLYVHRGTGHYGFPLRLGVPAEESVLKVHVAAGGAPYR
ncbi:phosphodiesterase [Sorangium cellulosum]|uniref:Phosphodiesterase n=1 Tax=Sorangium cellulosum TaxID=56 RepID=A0A2L0F6V5_SORCE|nr:metallophosphoesterase [Sorangium cellulosum]AUX47318.1 phosphodiesterase [Sorangium cellulosum]